MTELETHEGLMTVFLQAQGKEIFTEEEIQAASIKAQLSSMVSDQICRQAIKNIQTRFNVKMDIGHILEDHGQKPWYSIRRAETDPYYWNRYVTYLLRDKKFSQNVVNSIDKATNDIMDLLGDPSRKDPFKRRGLILGDVQSGKTATYIAICNKAADAGYKVIILLTGTIESLRRQTQSRIDEGFVGKKSSGLLAREITDTTVGVGVYENRRAAAVFTSEIRDFNASLLKTLGLNLAKYSEPSVFVIKKNKSALESLYEWLKTHNADSSTGYKIDLPLLLIDDEADNASINTRQKEDPTTINKGVRNLLALFTKTTYIGVTATPYANIFIDPDEDHDLHRHDLFPENFIYSLNPPSNYIGNEAIFGDDEKYINHVEEILDIDERTDEFLRFFQKKTIDLKLTEPMKSLEKSIYYFIIINGILDFRGYKNNHRTMLINVSQLKAVHSHIFKLVEKIMDDIVAEIQNYSELNEADAIRNSVHIRNIRDLWNLYDFEKKSGLNWEEFQKNNLKFATIPIELREVNSNAQVRKLNYSEYDENGGRFIVIGGNSLSRGLTLEGLCVSYFYRNSKMYDTLLQMGRWFGYRQGYEDLFRIWMTQDAIDWFQYITEATRELKDEIYRMNTYDLTPKDFGLRVRQDISSLMVTARNKMKHTRQFERIVSIAGRLIETPRLPASKKILMENYKNAEKYALRLKENFEESTTFKNAILYKDIPMNEVLGFLRNYYVEDNNVAFNVDAFEKYIKKNNHLKNWDVAFPYTKSGMEISRDLPVGAQKRSFVKKDDMLLVNGTKVRVGSGGCTQIGLDMVQVEEIDTSYKERGGKKNVPDNEYLIENRNPILLIHFLKPSENSEKLGYNDFPLVALGIGFPRVENVFSERATIKYIINLVALRKGMIEAEDEGDDFDEDDGT